MKLLLKARAGLVKKNITNSKGHKTTVWVKPDKKKSSGTGGKSHKEVYDAHYNKLLSQASQDMGMTTDEIKADKKFDLMLRKDARRVANKAVPVDRVVVDLGSHSMSVSQKNGVILTDNDQSTSRMARHITSYLPRLNNDESIQVKREIMDVFNNTKGDIKALKDFMVKRRNQ